MFGFGIFKLPPVHDSSNPLAADKATNEPTASQTVTGHATQANTQSLNPIYRLRKALPKGGGGEVYQATMDGETVAIKKSYPNSDVDLWAKEINIHSGLEHPNIVRFIKYDNVKNFLILEYINGQDLLETVNDIPLSWDNKTNILKGILNALTYLHEHDILHNDIKPENVLIEWGDYNCKAKLCDFGYATKLEGESTIRDTCVGTPPYIAPESMKEKRYSKKSDIYAQGLIAYLLAMEMHAFSNKLSPKQLLHSKVNVDLVSQLRKEAATEKMNPPEEIVDLVSQSCDPDYTRRPSAQELLNHPFFSEKKQPNTPTNSKGMTP